MRVGRIFGWFLLLAACAVLVRDALAWHDTHNFAPDTIGGLWFELSGNSLRIIQGLVEHIAPWLWTLAVGPVMYLWAAPSLIVLGAILLFLCRQPRVRRFY
jgi:hypothetical protein